MKYIFVQVNNHVVAVLYFENILFVSSINEKCKRNTYMFSDDIFVIID